ncbi:MAG TPA: class I SAM-dependent methyltransferase [Steroidobacteraceae bacterium]|nr:class I SAM-dependent methyltransferase [Steroidobacteraceae bacterium]
MANRSLQMTDELYRYLVEHSVREPEVLARLRAATASLPQAQMQIGPDQGQLMALLARLIGAKRCIEVGVFTGYSSLAVALALPPDGRILACDVSEEWTAIARRFWREAGVDHKIELKLQPATRTLEQLLAAGEAGRYDFAFIDADKPAYDTYYELLLQLLRPGGLIALDNTLWSGHVANPDNRDPNTLALRALNDKLHRDERIDVSLLPVGDGLTLARKR